MTTAKKKHPQNGGTVQLSVRVPPELLAVVDRYLEHFNKTRECSRKKRGDLIRDLLQVGLDELKKSTPLDGDGR